MKACAPRTPQVKQIESLSMPVAAPSGPTGQRPRPETQFQRMLLDVKASFYEVPCANCMLHTQSHNAHKFVYDIYTILNHGESEKKGGKETDVHTCTQILMNMQTHMRDFTTQQELQTQSNCTNLHVLAVVLKRSCPLGLQNCQI